MPITNGAIWKKWQGSNKDPYGLACVLVAKKAMEILDSDSSPVDAYKLVCRADDESGMGGITGNMAAYVAAMVAQCHSRGEEFKRSWNHEFDKDKEHEGVINPAVLVVGSKSDTLQ
jgi:hypothetical protein